jgi:hypothetical protein
MRFIVTGMDRDKIYYREGKYDYQFHKGYGLFYMIPGDFGGRFVFKFNKKFSA